MFKSKYHKTTYFIIKIIRKQILAIRFFKISL